jgi:hypothetical protein
MTPYQFGAKLAVKLAAAPQAASMLNGNAPPPTTGQRLEQYMQRVNQPAARPKTVRTPARTPAASPVLPNLNTSMLMGNNPPHYSQPAAPVGNMPVADIDVGPLDVPGKPSPSALDSLPSNKQLMSKVTHNPFSQSLAKSPPPPAPKPAPPTDVAKF